MGARHRELDELECRAEQSPGDVGLWPELLAAFGRAGRLADGVARIRRSLGRAGGGERLEAAFFRETYRAGFGLGDPLLQFPSPIQSIELAPDGRHLVVATARHGAWILETGHFSLRTRIPADRPFHLLEFASDGKALCAGLVEPQPPAPGHRLRLVFWQDGNPPTLTSSSCILPSAMAFRLLGASEDWRHFRVAGAKDTIGLLRLEDWKLDRGELAAIGFHRIGPYLPFERIAPESLPPNLRLVMPDGWLQPRPPPRTTLAGDQPAGEPRWLEGGTQLWIAAGNGSLERRVAPLVHQHPIDRVIPGGAGSQVLTRDESGAAVVWALDQGLPRLKLEATSGLQVLDLARQGTSCLVIRGIRYEVFDTRTRLVTATGLTQNEGWEIWRAAALSPDGSRLVYGTESGTCGVLALGAGARVWEGRTHAGRIAVCGFASGGELVWSVGAEDRRLALHRPGQDRALAEWELPAGLELGSWPWVCEVPGGQALVLAALGSPLRCRLGTPQPQPLLARPDGTGVYALSPDGAELAVALPEGGFDLYDMEPAPRATRPWCRERHDQDLGPIRSMAYGLDGKALYFAQSCHLRIHPRA